MASGFFAVLDDIALLMDDVAVTTKIAAGKTAGILGDDLAVNAEKATGFLASREIPVLWAITKGSLLNKLIIIPMCLLLNAALPAAINVILVFGGFYLAYEGVEKIVDYFFHRPKHQTISNNTESQIISEPKKIRSAITTDFILSIEIVIIALGSVVGKSITVQAVTVSIVAVLATIGVYGIVALIVRMDDFGYRLRANAGDKALLSYLGTLLIKALPIVIKTLGMAGTFALIIVAGGIISHNINALHQVAQNILPIIRDVIFGFTGGLLSLLFVRAGKKIVQALG